jgi:His/Glu/Gln/Arg/opine family amino acid ABC transporter permease subunit
MDFSLFIPNMIAIWEKYWQVFLLTGLKNTLILTCISVALGTVLGALVAMAKMSKYRVVRGLITVYIEVIRGTPILLQLYIFYFVLPNVLTFLKLSQFMWVSIALCVNSAAYVSEVIRSGIQAVDKGQAEAARSLGLSKFDGMQLVVLPQAIRTMIPSIINQFIITLKDTSILSVIGFPELVNTAKNVISATFMSFQTWAVVGFMYLAVILVLQQAAKVLERRLKYDA